MIDESNFTPPPSQLLTKPLGPLGLGIDVCNDLPDTLASVLGGWGVFVVVFIIIIVFFLFFLLFIYLFIYFVFSSMSGCEWLGGTVVIIHTVLTF